MTNTSPNGLDAIVVGTGFGGAVTAARLAEAGMRVLVLERGPWWTGSGSDPRARDLPRGIPGVRAALRGVNLVTGPRSMRLVIRRDGLIEAHVFDRMVAATASGVGGGSHLYADVMAVPEEAFFDHFPQELTAAEMRPWFDRVRAVLRPGPVPVASARTAVFDQAAAGLGLDEPRPAELAVDWGETTPRPRTNYLFGSTEGGKRTLDRTYVQAAVVHGAEVRALSEVTAIGRDRDGYVVHWRDHHARRPVRASAPRLVLATGCLSTLRLLFGARDRDRRLDVSDALGSRFTTGTDLITLIWRARVGPESPFGPCPGSTVSIERDGAPVAMLGDAGFPASTLPVPRRARRALSSAVLLAGMGRDSSAAVVTFDGREIRTSADRCQDGELFTRIEDVSASIAAAFGGRRVLVNVPFGRGSRRIFTVHPMGGAPIARSPKEGVVDHRGQVFGNPGLFVADGSLFPRGPACPPSMTIAALAERQASLIAADDTIDTAPSRTLRTVKAPRS